MPSLIGHVVFVALKRVLTVLDDEPDPLAVVHSDEQCTCPRPQLSEN